MSADQIRRLFRRLEHSTIDADERDFRDVTLSIPINRGSMSVDQVRRLHGASRNSAIPLRNDNRSWVRRPISIWNGCKNLARMLFKYRLNILLVFVPFAIAAGAHHWDSKAVFILNSMAIVPVPSLLNFAAEELSLNFGRYGGLVNGIFGRSIELIVSLSGMRR